jgi:hypothetical protein
MDRAIRSTLTALVRPFEDVLMRAGELVERWWNGRFGRLARRDVWLYGSATWRVESREGDADSGRGNTWTFDDEEQARAMVRRLLETGGDGWRDLAGPPAPSKAARPSDP